MDCHVLHSTRGSGRSFNLPAELKLTFKGRSYEEIDELFENKTPTRQFATTKTKVQLAKEELDLAQAQATA